MNEIFWSGRVSFIRHGSSPSRTNERRCCCYELCYELHFISSDDKQIREETREIKLQVWPALLLSRRINLAAAVASRSAVQSFFSVACIMTMHYYCCSCCCCCCVDETQSLATQTKTNKHNKRSIKIICVRSLQCIVGVIYFGTTRRQV